MLIWRQLGWVSMPPLAMFIQSVVVRGFMKVHVEGLDWCWLLADCVLSVCPSSNGAFALSRKTSGIGVVLRSFSVLLAYFTPAIVSGPVMLCPTASNRHRRIGIVRLEADKSIKNPKYDEKPPPPPVECCPASAAKAPPGRSKSILKMIFRTVLRTLRIRVPLLM